MLFFLSVIFDSHGPFSSFLYIGTIFMRHMLALATAFDVTVGGSAALMDVLVCVDVFSFVFLSMPEMIDGWKPVLLWYSGLL